MHFAFQNSQSKSYSSRNFQSEIIFKMSLSSIGITVAKRCKRAVWISHFFSRKCSILPLPLPPQFWSNFISEKDCTSVGIRYRYIAQISTNEALSLFRKLFFKPPFFKKIDCKTFIKISRSHLSKRIFKNRSGRCRLGGRF